MIILNGWYGRLGNNIIQLSNLIDIAISYKHNIKINVEKLVFFDLSVIENYFSKYNNSQKITDPHNFFYETRLPFSRNIFKQNAEQRNEILQKAFLLKNINTVPENELVIHIRSGDIFNSNPHPNYVPPPLSYYRKEISKYNYEKIHIICEDTTNPVVNELLKLYKNAVHKKNTLEKDIRIILGATNILFSVGTFIPALMLLSKNIKCIHNSFEDERYDRTMRPWKNTTNQRSYILTYDCN